MTQWKAHNFKYSQRRQTNTEYPLTMPSVSFNTALTQPQDAAKVRPFKRFRRRNSCTAKMLNSASIVRAALEEQAVSLSDSELESRCSSSDNSEHSCSEKGVRFTLPGKRLYLSDVNESSLEEYEYGGLGHSTRKKIRRGDFTIPICHRIQNLEERGTSNLSRSVTPTSPYASSKSEMKTAATGRERFPERY